MDTNSIERLSGSHLVLEVGLDVLVEIQGAGKRFKASLVGGEPGRYIIIKPPATRSAAESLLRESLLTLRFLMSRGRICGFQSEVQQVLLKPHRLIFVSYPAYFEILRLRKHDRVHCYQPVTFYVEAHEYRGHILNISTGGCLVTMDPLTGEPPLAEGGEAFLNFRKFDSNETGYVQGRIRNVTQRADQTSMAIEFDELTEDVRASIESYVDAVYDHLAA
ncbi:flagellar brake protein [Oceanidesulfovibrio indonesiensis]|nr:flagellar brake protein [Oceanidesulfovibrio indonesiensis]